jgi:hypothetical protein
MSRRRCTTPITLDTLAGYWLGELDAGAEAPVAEHLLGCEHCSAALQRLVDLGDGIRALTSRGLLRTVVSDDFVKRLADGGLRVREYAVARNGSVNCTVAPDDDVVISRLQAPLADVERLDLLVLDAAGGAAERLQDIPFDRATVEVVLAANVQQLRRLPRMVMRMRLVAVERGGQRVLGDYSFDHTPWPGN